MRTLVFLILALSLIFDTAAYAQTQRLDAPSWWSTQFAAAKDIAVASDPNHLQALSPEQTKAVFDLEWQIGSCLSKGKQQPLWFTEPEAKSQVRQCLADDWNLSDERLQFVLNIPGVNDLQTYVQGIDEVAFIKGYEKLNCATLTLSTNDERNTCETQCKPLWQRLRRRLDPSKRCKCCPN
jgi:hypothetical protein